jgi:hypothetical protein
MFPSDLENAYRYEVERRKDEMRDAAKDRLVRDLVKKRKSPVMSILILSLLGWLLSIMISQ